MTHRFNAFFTTQFRNMGYMSQYMFLGAKSQGNKEINVSIA
jgi:hypothetical protein